MLCFNLKLILWNNSKTVAKHSLLIMDEFWLYQPM